MGIGGGYRKGGGNGLFVEHGERTPSKRRGNSYREERVLCSVLSYSRVQDWVKRLRERWGKGVATSSPRVQNKQRSQRANGEREKREAAAGYCSHGGTEATVWRRRRGQRSGYDPEAELATEEPHTGWLRERRNEGPRLRGRWLRSQLAVGHGGDRAQRRSYCGHSGMAW
ncbi:4Fe-4S dicluster domain-containing protein [Sesbania bispinosa]|nr:4Fe-4S dicluster domain-containing protein [Sesbania bispinosa]